MGASGLGDDVVQEPQSPGRIARAQVGVEGGVARPRLLAVDEVRSSLDVVSQEVVHPRRGKMEVLTPPNLLQGPSDEHPQECVNDAQRASPTGAAD